MYRWRLDLEKIVLNNSFTPFEPYSVGDKGMTMTLSLLNQDKDEISCKNKFSYAVHFFFGEFNFTTFCAT